jgi:hypothetical protein
MHFNAFLRYNEAEKIGHNVKKMSVVNLRMRVFSETVWTRLLLSETPAGLSTMI